MKTQQVFDAVKAEYGEAIALLVVVFHTVALSTKLKDKDLRVKGRFWSRVCKKARERLWEEEEGDFALAVAISDALHEFDSRRVCEGLGGCTVATLHEIVERKAVSKTAAPDLQEEPTC